MKNKYISLLYDLLSIFFINLLYLSFVDVRNILIITSFNTLIILIFLLINFYKKSSTININQKINFILIVNFLIAISKFIFFGWATYLSFIVYQDILLFILLLLPRVFLNLKELNGSNNQLFCNDVMKDTIANHDLYFNFYDHCHGHCFASLSTYFRLKKE